MNIIFSGWPAAGGSTLAMLTALMVNYKYLYGGGLLKFLAERIYGSADGLAQLQFESELGLDWDNIWEPYAILKLTTSNGLVLEGKTAGFLIDGDNLFKMMVIADEATRASRAVSDNRKQAVQVIKQRDKDVRERWVNTLGVDIYDMAQINAKYDSVIDSSGEISISEELEIVIDAMRRSMKFEGVDFADLSEQIATLQQLYSSGGKLGIKQELIAKGLFLSPQEILADWKMLIPDRIERLPQKLKQAVLL